MKWIERIVESTMGRAQLLDMNIYDLLGSGRLAKVAAMSSGTLYESMYFNINTVRFLATPHRAMIPGFIDEPEQYLPMLPYVVQEEFWAAAITGRKLDAFDGRLTLQDRYIRSSVDIKWGDIKKDI